MTLLSPPRWPPSLSPRLRAVADQVPAGARLADIGCDHALLPITLLLEGSIASAIGIDVHAGPLDTARRHVERARVEVELRLGSGLESLEPTEVSAVTLAGMGGARICQLLRDAPAVVAELDAVIVQPNTDWPQLRRFAAGAGLNLIDETMVAERGHHYVVMRWSATGRVPRVWDELDFELGPELRRRRPPAFLGWLQGRRAELQRLLNVVGSASTQSDARQRALEAELEMVSRALRP